MATTLPRADKLNKPPKTADAKLREKLATQYERTYSTLVEIANLEARLAGAKQRAGDRLTTYDALVAEAGGQEALPVETS